jgi:hypothetical protein
MRQGVGMGGGDTKPINVIGESEGEGLRSEDGSLLADPPEGLRDADDHTPVGPQVGVAVTTCHETSEGRAACTVVLSLNGLGGYRRGQVIAQGNLPLEDGHPVSGTLRIVGGNAYDPAFGKTLIVEVWNPKKYSQTLP